MKAIRFHSHGDSGVLVREEVDRPQAGPGQVVLQVAGAGFNPLDISIRMGVMKHIFDVALPHTPGIEVSGVIAETGEGVDGWAAGDAAIAYLQPAQPGSFAEYAAVPAELLTAAPAAVDLVDAAGLPVSALTAHQSLFEHGGLKPGQRILVNGAGGGVGGIAVQLAVRAGAAVTATASARSAERTRSYGADRIIDYTQSSVSKALEGEHFDLVLQLARTSPEENARLADLVADGGVFVSTVPPGPESPGRGVRIAQVFSRSDAAQLAELVSAVDSGELKLDVSQRRPLAETAQVHDESAAGKLSGKTVLFP